jgi:hypothetical protein
MDANRQLHQQKQKTDFHPTLSPSTTQREAIEGGSAPYIKGSGGGSTLVHLTKGIVETMESHLRRGVQRWNTMKSRKFFHLGIEERSEALHLQNTKPILYCIDVKAPFKTKCVYKPACSCSPSQVINYIAAEPREEVDLGSSFNTYKR